MRKLQAAQKQLIFKWNRQGKTNVMMQQKEGRNGYNSITFGNLTTPGEVNKKRDCHCSIF